MHVDKSLIFSVVGEHKEEDCIKVLRSALSEDFSETFKKSFLSLKYEWKRKN